MIKCFVIDQNCQILDFVVIIKNKPDLEKNERQNKKTRQGNSQVDIRDVYI